MEERKKRRKRKTSKKTILIVIIAAVAVIGVVVGVIMNGADNGTITVSFAKVERRTVVQTVSATGKIQPETKVKVAPEVSGEIVDLLIKEGDTVTKGKLLARINPSIIETQLEQQKAYVDAAKQDVASIRVQMDNSLVELNRIKELYNKKVASKQDLDNSQAAYDAYIANYNATKARYNSAVASLKEIQVQAHKTTIFAPIDGIVTSLLVEKGERVVGTNMMSGTEMLTVSDLNVINAEVDVDENDIVLVKLGDTASIEIDAIPNKVFKGVVIEVGHSASTESGNSSVSAATGQTTTFSVKIRLLDTEARLRPGMSCSVEIFTAKHKDVLTVPLMAVTSRDQQTDTVKDEGPGSIHKEEKTKTEANKTQPKTIVFVKDGNKAKSKEVKIGISDMGYIEILAGLKEGETIISGPYQAVSKLLSDNAKIKEEKVLQRKK